jgi:hypothetical protein
MNNKLIKYSIIGAVSFLPLLAIGINCPLVDTFTNFKGGTGFTSSVTNSSGSTHFNLLAEYDRDGYSLDLDGSEYYIFCDNSSGVDKHQFDFGPVYSDWEDLYESYPKSSYDYVRLHIWDTADTTKYAKPIASGI